jgi:hypothetical protein
VAACAGVPKTPEPLDDQKIPLDEGAMAYVFISMPEARPILDHINIGGYSSAQVASILDKTRLAVAALYSQESGGGIRAVAWGDYPSLRAGMALGMSRDWKRQRSAGAGKSYWYSPAHRVSLALGRNQVFAAMAAPAADPFTQGPGIDAPEGFNAFREGACLALWMDEPAGHLDRFLSALRLPLRIPAEQLMAGLSALPDSASPAGTAAQTRYEIKLRLKAPSEANARTMMTLFSTARLFIFQAGNRGGMDPETFELLSLLFARPAEQEGASLTLRSPPLDEGGVALLFNLFSVYSQEKPVTK